MYANNAGTGYANANIFYLFLGAQQQWGYLQKQAEKWIYPIPVLEAFIATKTCISNNHSAAGYVGYWTWDKDITTEYAYSWNNYPSYCFMIGKVQQQWGLGNPSINFPIAFPKECFIAAITRAAGNYEHSIVITTKNKTNLSWICKGYDNSAGNTYANWLALGCQLQWGKYTNSGNDRVITYPIAFSELYYANVISPDNCETFVYGISNTNINYRLCNGYNDDRWNGTQTSRLFAVGR